MISSTPFPQAPQASQAVQAPSASSWDPIVLSLDGGGVKGLSSLYILREIMDQIQTDNKSDVPGNQTEQDDGIALPCNYFDFIIGTSTGGVIAIMLGRLRMSVDECIEQYWKLANKIFVPHKIRFIQRYSRQKVKEAAENVVRRFCKCHDNPAACTGYEQLRQYDFEEQGARQNNSCKVAVFTVRAAGYTTHVGGNAANADQPRLLRSYDHSPRSDHSRLSDRPIVYNPRTLQGSTLSISQACQCTTAAPTYFHPVSIQGRKYIDGGVLANNPAAISWYEALDMSTTFPQLLLSIGTGTRKKHSRFGLGKLLLGALSDITGSEKEHKTMLAVKAARPNLQYFRLDVPETPRGLADIDLDQCKKKTISNSNLSMPALGNLTLAVQRCQQRDSQLRQNAKENTKGGYKPDKYCYVTFDKIRDHTATYCNDRKVEGNIRKCARILRNQSLQRRAADTPRWDQFRRHPDPNYH